MHIKQLSYLVPVLLSARACTLVEYMDTLLNCLFTASMLSYTLNLLHIFSLQIVHVHDLLKDISTTDSCD